MHTKKILTAGSKLKSGSKALIMIHGRGADAGDILSLSSSLDVGDFSLIAPQATNHTWYPYSFLAPRTRNEPWLSSALEVLKGVLSDVINAGIPEKDIYFLGFSQGACLTLEFVARNPLRYGGVVGFTGGLIGDDVFAGEYKGDLKGTPVFIGTGNPDPHVPVERVHETITILQNMHAIVTGKIYPGLGHTINQDEINTANKFIFGNH